VGENYFPEAIKDEVLYQPTEQGLEAKIKAKLERFKALDAGSEQPRYQHEDL
ncbi:MAG TPA: recombination factor protein RarA, partial [Cellvibrionales bacterium]|nr:recombination factor protein RarA [Cellvibrionales bacterium]